MAENSQTSRLFPQLHLLLGTSLSALLTLRSPRLRYRPDRNRTFGGLVPASQNSRANKTANKAAWLNASQSEPTAECSAQPEKPASAKNPPHPQLRPLVGVVPTHLPGEASLRLPDRYSNALIAAGATPVVLPVVDDLSVYEALFPLLDGFILTGGKDIDPARYKEAVNPNDAICKTLSEFEPKREELEGLVLRYAKTFDIPTLGICRGMQVINVFFGGTLYLDLDQQLSGSSAPITPYSEQGVPTSENQNTPDSESNPSEPNKATSAQLTHWQKKAYDITTHEVHLVAGSRIASILNCAELAVNSMHHQGVREVAPGFTPTAFATDGLVEAIEDPAAHFLMGVQWHPEFFAGEKGMGSIFSELIKEAHACHERRSREKAAMPQQLIITPMHPSVWPETTYGDYI